MNGCVVRLKSKFNVSIVDERNFLRLKGLKKEAAVTGSISVVSNSIGSISMSLKKE